MTSKGKSAKGESAQGESAPGRECLRTKMPRARVPKRARAPRQKQDAEKLEAKYQHEAVHALRRGNRGQATMNHDHETTVDGRGRYPKEAAMAEEGQWTVTSVPTAAGFEERSEAEVATHHDNEPLTRKSKRRLQLIESRWTTRRSLLTESKMHGSIPRRRGLVQAQSGPMVDTQQQKPCVCVLTPFPREGSM